jgi:hypothetical protein
VLLWEATRRWKEELDAGLVALGYPWAARPAPGSSCMSGDRESGSPSWSGGWDEQQAVQQLLDDLVADGVVERKADAEDGRAG